MISLGAQVGQNTLKFLHTISDHLSWNDNYQRCEYYIRIISGGAVMFDRPRPELFRDTHHRKSCDKIDIVAHVLLDHLPEFKMVGTAYCVDTQKVASGTYIYEFSFDERRRRWRRVGSVESL